MNILILGDIMGPSGREAIIKELPNLIKKKKLDFVIVNGENAADPGVGITKKNTEEFFANTIRRLIIGEVPTLAVEDVEIKENSSQLYDEMIALRLGLSPIKTDLNSYNFKNECKCEG